ncbi:hypothetical protein SCUCBS95973_002204 [Sporothrix curviconia]|uniref:Uncharacterized protein n=1 Tax=Sporothrix curviconia TaxID=1260050 RepID=A0ABP0B4U3_9PEZI
MPSRKPTLVLSTPVTASFPAEALMSAASVRTPHSALSTTWREAAGLASAGLASAGLASAGLPSAGLPSAGLSSAGLPSAGLPSAGLRSAGLHSAGLYSPIVAIKTEEGLIKTPLSPPVAYMDFLKMASPGASPCTSNTVPSSTASAAKTATAASATGSTRPRVLHRASISGPVKITASSNLSSLKAATSSKPVQQTTNTSTATSAANSDTESSGNDTEDKDTLDSGPSTAASTASSNATDCCTCDHEHSRHERAHKSPKISRIDTAIPASPFAANNCPMSAPPMGSSAFPSLKIPVSPAVSSTHSPIRSPFSAKSTSITSAFDWESALKARYAEFKSPRAHPILQAQAQAQTQPSSCTKCKPAPAATTSSTSTSSTSVTTATNAAKTSVRHIREVVTRTVTYTPRMDPPRMNAPPKGKKRKIDSDETA